MGDIVVVVNLDKGPDEELLSYIGKLGRITEISDFVDFDLRVAFFNHDGLLTGGDIFHPTEVKLATPERVALLKMRR